MIDTIYSTVHFDTSLVDLELIQGRMSGRKQKHLRQLSYKVFNQFERDGVL